MDLFQDVWETKPKTQISCPSVSLSLSLSLLVTYHMWQRLRRACANVHSQYSIQHAAWYTSQPAQNVGPLSARQRNVMIDVWRVKIKVTLCMLDKFSYFCHLYHVQFNIKTILGTSPVRPFGHVWSGFKLLQARNLFVSLSGQTDLLKLYARVVGSSRHADKI